jgi:hypothetical protein
MFQAAHAAPETNTRNLSRTAHYSLVWHTMVANAVSACNIPLLIIALPKHRTSQRWPVQGATSPRIAISHLVVSLAA